MNFRRPIVPVALVLFAALQPNVAGAQQAPRPPTAGGDRKDEPPASDRTTAKERERRQSALAADEEAQRRRVEQEQRRVATPSGPAAAAPAAATDVPAERAFEISAELGFTRVDFGGLSDSTDLDKTGANGFLYGGGMGARVRRLRAGLRFRGHATTEFTLWALMLEAGYGLDMRPIQPVFNVHLGYVWDTSVERSAFAGAVPPGNFLPPDVDVKGAVLGVEAVASYWATSFLRVGPFLGADVLLVSRSQTALPQSIFALEDSIRRHPLYNDSGGGLGYAVNAGVRGTFDIGF